VVLSDVHDTAPKVSATRLTLTCDELGPPKLVRLSRTSIEDEMRENIAVVSPLAPAELTRPRPAPCERQGYYLAYTGALFQ
jgi:hypothetical protein